MAIQIQNLDLEEQEQLDQLKHFWKQWGNLISWVLIVIFGSYAAYNGWQWWQRNQAVKAALLYDEVERAAQAADLPKLERALGDMKDQFGGTAFAGQSALLAGKVFFEHDKPDLAQSALTWVAQSSKDDGYRASARLRLAAIELQQKQYDAALKTLGAGVPAAYEPLVADRKGDVLLLQGKKDEAAAEYKKAYTGLKEDPGYQHLVEAKLMSLGINPAALLPAKPSAAAPALVPAGDAK